MANTKPINKNNPKNIYCAHCKHWVNGTKDSYCGNRESKFVAKHRDYWHRCKNFEWRAEDGKAEET